MFNLPFVVVIDVVVAAALACDKDIVDPQF